MPSRLIRDGLLDSERYWSCTIEARELYRHLQLLADDFGCVGMASAFIGRRCFDQRPTNEKLAALVLQLCDADLIRPYEVDNAKYAFIPRFKQRLQRATLKHPRPPHAALQGDDHAQDLFNRINEKMQTPTVAQPTKGSRREVEELLKTPRARPPVDNFGDKSEGRSLYTWAKKTGYAANPGESAPAYRDRLKAEWMRMKKSESQNT